MSNTRPNRFVEDVDMGHRDVIWRRVGRDCILNNVYSWQFDYRYDRESRYLFVTFTDGHTRRIHGNRINTIDCPELKWRKF